MLFHSLPSSLLIILYYICLLYAICAFNKISIKNIVILHIASICKIVYNIIEVV